MAAVLAQRGRDVLLIDGDEQGSAATFAAIRAELPEKAEFATIQLQGAAIRQQMRQLREKYSEMVIDVGGRDTGSLRAALTVSDIILIPFQPRSVDLWAGRRSRRWSRRPARSTTGCAPVPSQHGRRSGPR